MEIDNLQGCSLNPPEPKQHLSVRKPESANFRNHKSQSDPDELLNVSERASKTVKRINEAHSRNFNHQSS